MATLAIIAVVFFIAYLLTECEFDGLPLVTCISLILTLLSTVTSFAYVPDGYTVVDSVSYMNEAGYIETLDECDYYTDGTDYYEQKLDKAVWVPFAPAEYVKVELPGKVVSWEPADKADSTDADAQTGFCASCGKEFSEGDKFCAACGNEFAEDDNFCGGCGTARPENTDTAQQFCTNCGKELADADKFCGGCGASVKAKE